MSERSFNGWLVLDEYPTATFTAPGGKTVYCNSREVAVVMEYWARRWHNEIEPIAKSHPDNWTRPRERHGTTKAGKWDAIGIHSWRPPGTKVGTGDQSNHRSATGIDINGHLHPYEYTVPPGTYRDGFTQAQRDKVRAIAHAPRDNAGKRIGRSGLDFARGRRDGMHLEIGPGVSRVSVQQAAKRLEDEIGRSSTGPVWWRNAYGHDVAAVQGQLNRAGFNAGTEDGSAGAKTDSAVRALQKAAGITVDGRVGPGTREALALAEIGEGLEPITEEAELMAAADEIVQRVTDALSTIPAAVWAHRNPGYSGHRDAHGLLRDAAGTKASNEAIMRALSELTGHEVNVTELAQALLPELIEAVKGAGDGATAEQVADELARRLNQED